MSLKKLILLFQFLGSQAFQSALGYSEESKIPFELSIIRNHYVGRTFILPTQSNRQSSVKLKHNPDRASIKGKSVVLVDDCTGEQLRSKLLS